MHVFMTVCAVLVIVLGLLWLLVPALYGLPPIATNQERARRALELVELKPGESFYDLGSGHGQILILAAKEFGAHTTGIEAGPVQCAVARINALCNGVSSKVKIEAGDFFKADLSHAAVVYAYLTSRQAKRLEEKLRQELKPGARVVTIAFNFPNWSPTYFDRDNLIYLYKK